MVAEAVAPKPKDDHHWTPLDPGSPYHYCAECRISGKQIGSSWPPMRDPLYIGTDFITCAGAKRAKIAADMKRYGLSADDVTE